MNSTARKNFSYLAYFIQRIFFYPHEKSSGVEMKRKICIER